MAKRANGEGHIRRRKKDNSWEARITVGYDSLGKQKFKYFSSKTRLGALAKKQDYLKAINAGISKDFKDMSLSKWLDFWYQNYVVGKTKMTTRVNDESIIKHHIKPALGRINLSKLKGIHIQPFYNQLLIDGRVDKKGGLSPKTIRNIHIVLHRALEQAVKNDLIIKNPLYSVSLPKNVKKEIEILSPDEQRKLVEICKGDEPWYMAILLTLYSGMRMGELLGLTWDNIDFENNKIVIEKQVSRLKDYSKGAKNKTRLYLREETKTACSRRKIIIAKVIMERLKEYKKAQSKLCKSLGNDYNRLNLVFMSSMGTEIDPATFRSFYLRTLRKAEISPKTFHALRHTFATRALESGVNIKVISEILGHATIQITLDTYSHVSNEEQEKAMEKIVEKFW